MFEAGFTELLLIFVLGLLILGPERLPGVAAQLGRWIGRARRTASQLRRQLEREVELAELAERRAKLPRPTSEPSSPGAASAETPSGSTPAPAQPSAEPPAASAPAPESPSPAPDGKPEA